MTLLNWLNPISILWISASLFLTACGSTDQSKSVDISSESDLQSKIIKSPMDNREYVAIILDNQLEMILVSDPSIEKSAAALSVAVGSLHEPKEFGGLAHYLEHMLLLGTKSYPDVGAFNEFVTRNGGIQNANTQLSHTNYTVAVNNEAYNQALSRFSGFFYEALLDERYAEKERHSVHSEWTMQAPNDWVILEQLNGTTLNPEHPISQFNWGNLDSLADKQNHKLQTALVDMYNTFYSANLMKGTMISHLPIDEMKKLAQQHFGKIPNKNTHRPNMTVAVAKPQHLKKIVRYRPQTDMKQLRVNFVIKNNADQFAVKPNGYVSYLLASEMPGTLSSVLRGAGLSESVYANYDPDKYGNAGSFTLYIDLTETGVQNRDKVMAATLKYLALLREKGVDSRYFNEIKQSLNNSFRFQEKISDYDYAKQIAADLQYVAPRYVLNSQFEYQHFDPQAIQSTLDQLTLNNARIFYIDKAQQGDTQMQYFAATYSVQDITPGLQQKWQDLSTQFSLGLPSSNRLMPENFNLVSPTYIEEPIQLANELDYTMHLGHSALFKQPKGIAIIDLNSELAKSSARHRVLAEIFGLSLRQRLFMLQSEANAAGMVLNIDIANGIVLTVSGFTDKQNILLKAALKEIVNFEISERELADLKVSYISGIESVGRQNISNQLWHKFSKMVFLDEYSDVDMLAEVETINLKQITQFKDELLTKYNLRMFAFGNYSEKNMKDLAGIVHNEIPSGREISNIYQTPLMPSQGGHIYSWQEDSDMSDIGLIDAYLVPATDAYLAAARMLSSFIHPALLKQIRTEEQLAYNVSFGGQTLNEQILMAFEIQSSVKGLAEVHQRIGLFRQGFTEHLAQVTPEVFASTKKGLLIALSQPAKNLSEEMGQYIEDWGYQKWQFDSKKRLIAGLEKVTLDDVVNLYKRIQDGKEFGRFLIQMRGTKFSDKAFVEPEGVIKVTDIDSFHQQFGQ